MSRLILASASPRRKELLEQIGVEFQILPAQGDEVITKETPWDVVMELSLQKAMQVADKITDTDVIILGADTVVSCNGSILGKPKNRQDAISMLSQLAGNTHCVYTGVAVIIRKDKNEEILNFYEETAVTMYPMSRKEMEAYADTPEPYDKAGGYAIQGKCAVHIEKITGDYNNVVGLPIARIYQELRKAGIDIKKI